LVQRWSRLTAKARLDATELAPYITPLHCHSPYMEHLYDYLSFLAKSATVVGALLVLAAGLTAMGLRRQVSAEGHLEVRHLNDKLRAMSRSLSQAFTPTSEFKKIAKREDKRYAKERKQGDRRRVFVLDFNGDLQASAVGALRNEVTAVLTSARNGDEVVVRVESPGGMVHAYGLAASQLARVRQAGIRLTTVVDKVAASGGYLVAAVAERVVAAPFALVGSIGVMAQVPNVHRLLKNHDIDVEVLTAGKYKRTLTVLGENTEQGRAKFIEELEDVHVLFQDFVATNRPTLDIAAVATGESWYGRRALDRKLVDELMTSDEYLMRACEDADVFELRWVEHKRPIERVLEKFVGFRSKSADLVHTRIS